MLIATALNSLTTTTGMETIIHLFSPNAELYLLYERQTPEALRMTMSSVFVKLRQVAQQSVPAVDQNHVVDRLHKLADLLDRGMITENEYETLKASLMAELG